MHEFEFALEHCIKVVRKKRLIVLVKLSDAVINGLLRGSGRPGCDEATLDGTAAADTPAECGPDSLRHYLRHYTYIDYGRKDWFQRLLYALPTTGLIRLEGTWIDDDSIVPLVDDE